MAIAHRDIEEIYNIITRYVLHEDLGPLFAALRMTKAAEHNKSFQETVWRLLTHHVEKK